MVFHDSGGGGGACVKSISRNLLFITIDITWRSSTNTHASSRAVRLLGAGRRSSLSAGYARRQRIVVSCSRSYASRNCCFADVGTAVNTSSWFAMAVGELRLEG